ncbi:MAG: sugar phosphate isomerase/epimerase [Chthonomonas sp.]|nr:sugar phosphate isomerase/epimerase [Chthonomonas sp.]
MIKAINYWSFPGGLEGTLPAREAIDLARDNGFPALELAINCDTELCLSTTEAECREIVAYAESQGVGLHTVASGMYWGRSVGDTDPALRATAIEDLRAMIRITSWLGATVLLTIPGAVDVFFLPDRAPQPYGEVMRNAAAGLREVLPLAAEHKVRLGIENVWNKILMSPGEMEMFLAQFDSEWIGAYLDVGNILPFGYPEDWILHLGDKIAAIHMKDFRRSVGTAAGFVDLLEGDVDFPAVMKALRAIGYEGPLTAEMIPLYARSPMVRIANTSRALDEILQS